MAQRVAEELACVRQIYFHPILKAVTAGARASLTEGALTNRIGAGGHTVLQRLDAGDHVLFCRNRDNASPHLVVFWHVVRHGYAARGVLSPVTRCSTHAFVLPDQQIPLQRFRGFNRRAKPATELCDWLTSPLIVELVIRQGKAGADCPVYAGFHGTCGSARTELRGSGNNQTYCGGI